jgi:hypothetical protein
MESHGKLQCLNEKKNVVGSLALKLSDESMNC